MPEAAQESDGPLESVRRLGRSVVGLVQTRAELFALEVQEEKLRLLGLLTWCAIAVALTVAGVLIAVGVLAIFVWDKAGYAGLIGLAVIVLALAATTLLVIRRQILRGPGPFAETIKEFRKDASSLGSQS